VYSERDYKTVSLSNLLCSQGQARSADDDFLTPAHRLRRAIYENHLIPACTPDPAQLQRICTPFRASQIIPYILCIADLFLKRPPTNLSRTEARERQIAHEALLARVRPFIEREVQALLGVRDVTLIVQYLESIFETSVHKLPLCFNLTLASEAAYSIQGPSD